MQFLYNIDIQCSHNQNNTQKFPTYPTTTATFPDTKANPYPASASTKNANKKP